MRSLSGSSQQPVIDDSEVNQFDIFDYPFDEEGAHPCVILSRTDYCGRSRVNALYCTSQRQSRPAKPTEVMLDTADGLD